MGRMAYLFPGQGSQQIGMGRALAGRFEEAAQAWQEADDALGFPLSRLVDEGPAEALALTENTQPAVLAASVAILRAAQAANLAAADFVAGHSLGEYSALVAAGALSFSDALRTVRLRGRLMQEAVPVGEGAMAAVLRLSSDAIAEACAETQAERPGEVVVPANLNGPEQTVIAGHAGAVTRAGEKCLERGARKVMLLDVSAPFHSPLMEPVREPLAAALAQVRFVDAAVALVTNVKASPETSSGRLRALLVEQVTAPVRWTEVVARLAAEGCDTFVEMGPGAVLSGLVRRQLPGARALSISVPDALDAALLELSVRPGHRDIRP